MINPMVVDGQVFGGAAQGVGTALFEEMPYDESGQPMANTLAEYLLPSACEMPQVRIEHMETPSPFSYFGQKGLGEGGAIGPPAAIVNAINRLLRIQAFYHCISQVRDVAQLSNNLPIKR